MVVTSFSRKILVAVTFCALDRRQNPDSMGWFFQFRSERSYLFCAA